jgi:uncharacterized protein
LTTLNIPLFPLNTVLFPDGLLPLRVFEVRYIDMVRNCLRHNTPFGIVNISRGSDKTDDDNDTDSDTDADVKDNYLNHKDSTNNIGTLATIVDFDMIEPSVLMIAAQGGQRFKVLHTHAQANGLVRADIALLPLLKPSTLTQQQHTCAALLSRIISDLENQQQEAEKAGHKTFCFPIAKPYQLNDSGWIAHRFSEIMPISRKEKQMLLELDDAQARLDWVENFLKNKEII